MSAPALFVAQSRCHFLAGDEGLRTVVGNVRAYIDDPVDITHFGTLSTYLMLIKGAMTWNQIVHLMTAEYTDAIKKASCHEEKSAILVVLNELEKEIVKLCK
jgi:hypothetical protein